MSRLKGKSCVVTGAGRGIGEAIARAFVAEGAEVLLTDIDAVRVESVAASLGMAHLRLDVGEEADWRSLAAVRPKIDVVVNNAGVTGLDELGAAHDPEHATLEAWRWCVA